MSWVTPRTWSSGELVGASLMNEQVRDNHTVLKNALTDDGKVIALTSTYLESTDGSALTGVAKTAHNNEFTDGVSDFSAGAGTRLIVPVGANRWST